METDVNYTIVGIFVITLLTAIVLAIIWLSSGFSFEGYSTYAVYMKESVTGLSIDSPVEYNGVNIGSVSDIQLDKKNPQSVLLLLSIKESTPITVDTVATLNTKGITGIAYVALKDTGSDLRKLEAQAGEKYPVIKTAPSLFMRLDTALGELSSNFSKISTAINSLLDEQNQKSIREILINLNQVTHTLSVNSQKLNDILVNTAQASQEFIPLLQAGTDSMKTLQMQTLPSANQLLLNLNEISRSLAAVTADIKQNPAVLIRGVNDQQRLGPGETR
ncbi:MAG: hypothetical protein A3F12_04815 [Gammaproteobacteria bacterium RIFCSPHIGHO2_12_FULL_38_14]|nr:MAG: hypothetical protein A3F12_04815 [Gammaproteobacteria bacterium RIFCSPHIGHO2_12_FULL_38_14]